MQATQKPPSSGLKGEGGENPNSPDGFRSDENNNEMDVKAATELRLQEAIKHAEGDFETFTLNDQLLKRKDTVEVVVEILGKIKEAADEINKQS